MIDAPTGEASTYVNVAATAMLGFAALTQRTVDEAQVDSIVIDAANWLNANGYAKGEVLRRIWALERFRGAAEARTEARTLLSAIALQVTS
jgi:hypothetical protein